MIEKGIIEKLGITPGPWEKGIGVYTRNPELFVVADSRSTHSGRNERIKEKDSLLIAAAPEMLEALIDLMEGLEDHDDEFYISDKQLQEVKKATGKTWEQTKELL